jgi:putative nucleotidyltransferase with HDIG domain
MNHKRWTIGLLIDYSDSQYQFDILHGVSDCAEMRDVNLLCFEGGIIDSTNNFDLERNIIYDLVSDKRIDGAIILSDSIGLLLNQDMLYQFTQRFSPLPVVSVGRTHGSLHSVIVDTSSGMREMVLHLVTHHNYRRFAFIKGLNGSQEADKRLTTFCSVMLESGIPEDFIHIFEGDYLAPAGARAVCKLFDELRAEVDVIIASNDEMALGALAELTRRGISVPDDIAVVGVDDISKSSIVNPPLTTVRQPVHKVGWTAVEILLDILNKKQAAMVTELKSVTVVRQSCGCNMAESVIQSSFYKFNRDHTKKELETECLSVGNQEEGTKRILDLLLEIRYDSHWMNGEELAAELTARHLQTINEQDSRIFTTLWKSFLDRVLQIEKDSVFLQQILKILFSMHSPAAENVFNLKNIYNETTGILYAKTAQTLKQQNSQSQKETWVINSILDELHINFDTGEIMNILYKKMITLGVKSTYLSLYETTAAKTKINANLVLAYRTNTRFELPDRGFHFPVIEIIPDFCFPELERFTLIIESLNYMTQNFGFIIFDMCDMKENINCIYGVLRRIISNVIHAAHLLSQVEQQRNKLIETVSSLRTTVGAVISTLALTVEIRDPYTAGHQHRVSDLSRAIATKLGLPADKIEGLRMSGIVHDIGKIFVPAEILNKPGKLMDIEFNLIKHHAQAGYNILKQIEFPWPIADIVLQHHERCDGSGYPCGLKGNVISIEAKILSIADVVEAITSMRPYRAALGIDVALEEIARYKGTRYDEDAVNACISVFSEDGFEFK